MRQIGGINKRLKKLLKLGKTNKKILRNIDSNVKSIKMKLETKAKPEWNYTDQDAWKIDFKVSDTCVIYRHV